MRPAPWPGSPSSQDAPTWRLLGPARLGKPRGAAELADRTGPGHGGGRLRHRRGTPLGAPVRRDLRGTPGPRARGPRAHPRPALLLAAGRLPAARRGHPSPCRGRPLHRRRRLHGDQRRVPRLPVHPHGQRAPAPGLPGPRGEGTHGAGAAPRDVVPPPVRDRPRRDRRSGRGRRPAGCADPGRRARRALEDDHAPRHVRRPGEKPSPLGQPGALRGKGRSRHGGRPGDRRADRTQDQRRGRQRGPRRPRRPRARPRRGARECRLRGAAGRRRPRDLGGGRPRGDRGDRAVSAGSTSRSTRSAAPSGPSPSSTTRPSRSRPRSAARSIPRSGRAGPCCRT